MGLDAGYPYVGINDPDHGHATVYDERHRPIGRLGPSPYESPQVNVTCVLRAWGCRHWYKLLNPAGFSATAKEAFVSANQTRPGPYSLPIPRCSSRCWWAWLWWLLLPVAVAVAKAAFTRKGTQHPPRSDEHPVVAEQPDD